jgi:hypothetical protein
MRYGIAVIVAVILVSAAELFIWSTKRVVDQIVSRAGEGARRDETPDPDARTFGKGDFGVAMPAAFVLRISIANLIATWRWILIPAIVLGCLGVAWLLGAGRPVAPS